MENRIKQNSIKSCLLIFLILITVHAFEAIVLRMDETVFGENFINKLFGIAVIWITLRILNWTWEDIGFAKRGFGRSIFCGFSLAAVTFLIAYFIEVLILKHRGNTVHFGIFTTGFSLTGEPVTHNGFFFILMCVFFNIINVIMEEGTFRGLFCKLIHTDHSLKTAILIQAFLFGIWHVVTPLHNYIDGDIDGLAFLLLSIGYIILAGMMGIKWGLMAQMTGSLYAGMADHFFNNCIATNLLHITSESGTDELMIIRVLIAQILSFLIIIGMWKKKGYRLNSL